MDTKALRQKILDLAIRGKLVPQDPNDEPASVLLERIRAEKQQMVKEGKLKAKDIKNDTVIFVGEDNLHYEKFPDGSVKCIEEEIPFELPKGWEWARISSICLINPKNTLEDSLEVSFIPMPLIQEGFANFHSSDVKEWRKIKSGFTHFAEGDIAIAKITPCFENRKSVIFSNLKNGYGAGTTELHILRPMKMLPEYILWTVKSENFISKGIQSFTGAVGQQRIGKEFVSSYLVSVPPVAEQHRIIKKIEQDFYQLSLIENEKKSLQILINQTKSKILDLAIRGKLVPQDPNDEPASVLLERIRAEKEEHIKLGKIKRDKKESVILRGEDNSYYDDIPNNWATCYLSELFNVCSAKRVRQSDWRTEGVPFYRAREIVKLADNGYVDNDLFISEEHFQAIAKDNGVPQPGDLMVSGVGTIGKIYIVKESDKFYYKDASVLCFENRKNVIDSKFAKYMLESDFLQGQMKDNSKGTTVDTITISSAMLYICILPPLAEQIRIVTAIESAFAQLDQIANAIA